MELKPGSKVDVFSRWVIVAALAVVAAALWAGPDFGDFLIYLAGILLLGLGMRALERNKRQRGEKLKEDE